MPAKSHKKISLFQAMIPVVTLVIMLAYNVLFVYKDNALSGSNQFILLVGAAIGILVGIYNKVNFEDIITEITENIKSTTTAIIILLLVGSLSGTWLVSGIIPSMIYYGLEILNPSIFLAASVVICALVSVTTGSSWTTSATIGVALIGIGQALNIPLGLTAGAVLSGAYFGDKMSPMSDTTNLAPAMAGTDLFTHIRYMTLTTVPTIILTIIIFLIIGFNIGANETPDTSHISNLLTDKFNISLWLFIVPLAVIGMVIKKVNPLIALFLGTISAAITAIIAQPHILMEIANSKVLNFETTYRALMDSITIPVSIDTNDANLSDLFSSKGMSGMLSTIWLIICAMVYGGVMESIGALERITETLLKMFHTVFGLFASTVASCLALNLTVSDQYLAIVVPGKMFSKAYQEKGLAPENLSRTLEDSATVTSVLVPWNICAAYNSGVLGVPTIEYLPYAFFNIISPFMTLLFAAFRIKIKMLGSKVKEA